MKGDYEEIKTALDFALKNVHKKWCSWWNNYGKVLNSKIIIEKFKNRKSMTGLKRNILPEKGWKKNLVNLFLMLAEDYESSGSDSEAESDFKGLSQNQLRFLMRKKLLHKNFDSSVLEEVKIY